MNDTAIKENYLGSIRLALSPKRDMEKVILEGGVWSAEVIHIIQMLIRPGDYVADIGANSGLISLPLAVAVGQQGKVVSFEPDAESMECFRRNIDLNSDLKQRIDLACIGVGEREGTLFLYHDTHGGNAYLAPEGIAKFGQVPDCTPEPCRIVALDSFWNYPRLDFIKIDVEGMENLVLRGAKRILAHHRPTIVFETMLRCFDHKDILECETILRELGYFLFVKYPEGKLFPSRFPNFGEDTVAIHPHRFSRTVHSMMNAAHVTVEGNQIWIAAVEPGKPFAVSQHGSCRAEIVNTNLCVLLEDLNHGHHKRERLSIPISALEQGTRNFQATVMDLQTMTSRAGDAQIDEGKLLFY